MKVIINYWRWYHIDISNKTRNHLSPNHKPVEQSESFVSAKLFSVAKDYLWRNGGWGGGSDPNIFVAERHSHWKIEYCVYLFKQYLRYHGYETRIHQVCPLWRKFILASVKCQLLLCFVHNITQATRAIGFLLLCKGTYGGTYSMTARYAECFLSENNINTTCVEIKKKLWICSITVNLIK